MMQIRNCSAEDYPAITALWQRVLPDDQPHNEPSAVIAAKLQVDNMLFVAEEEGEIVGTVMAGYDGHRGWLYSVAVSPECQRQGCGRKLVEHALQALKQLGCCKVNLQVRSDNEKVVAFYRQLGFAVEERISMGLLI